jgi:hypothetical protein
MNSALQGSVRTASSEALIRSRVAHTESVRVEFPRCRPQATVQWNVARPPLDHPDGDTRLGCERGGVGHMRLHHPRRVVCPRALVHSKYKSLQSRGLCNSDSE